MKRVCQSRSSARRATVDDVPSLSSRVTTQLILIGRRPASFRRRDAALDLLQRAEAHDLLQPLGLKVSTWMLMRRRPASARVGPARKKDGVGGLATSSTPSSAADARHDLHDVGAQGGVASGEPELPEAHRDRRLRHALDLGRGQQLRRRDEAQPRRACSRHTADCSGRSPRCAGNRSAPKPVLHGYGPRTPVRDGHNRLACGPCASACGYSPPSARRRAPELFELDTARRLPRPRRPGARLAEAHPLSPAAAQPGGRREPAYARFENRFAPEDEVVFVSPGERGA